MKKCKTDCWNERTEELDEMDEIWSVIYRRCIAIKNLSSTRLKSKQIPFAKWLFCCFEWEINLDSIVSNYHWILFTVSHLAIKRINAQFVLFVGHELSVFTFIDRNKSSCVKMATNFLTTKLKRSWITPGVKLPLCSSLLGLLLAFSTITVSVIRFVFLFLCCSYNIFLLFCFYASVVHSQ